MTDLVLTFPLTITSGLFLRLEEETLEDDNDDDAA
jgi:hypothetical protein